MENLNVFGKTRKVQNFFHSNRNRRINEKINEEGSEGVVTISEKVQFIDIARLTATSTA